MSVLSVVFCQVEVSATEGSPVHRSPTECGVSECDPGTSQKKPRPIRDV
jgi:hypothetical protein